MLTDFKIGQILVYNIIDVSFKKLLTKRSKTAVFHFLQNPTIYGTAKSIGKTKILSTRSKLLIVRTVSDRMTRKEQIKQHRLDIL